MTSGTGTCTVKYNQAGNDNYNAAAQVTETVTAPEKANQTIVVTTVAPAAAVYNTSFTVAATGGASGNPVTFGAAGVCSNVAATFTMTSGTGTCTVKYDQAGDGNYNAASQIIASVTAQQADQTITFAALANKIFGDMPCTVHPRPLRSARELLVSDPHNLRREREYSHHPSRGDVHPSCDPGG